jgi:pimeloyl-ACP methyl ester carboxylesterase
MAVPWLTFAAVMLITLALLCCALVVLMANTLLRPNRMTDARATWILRRLSPRDLDLDFEELSFEVRDERTGKPLKIRGWWIPATAPSSRTVLLIHGYADAKVGGIAWAPAIHSCGWNIVAIDLRAHGESGGVHSTAGYFERHDVNQVLNQFRAQRPRETRDVAIFGVSLGAAVALAATVDRDPCDIAGVILESPFGDYRRAITAHGRMRGLPEGIIRDAAVRLAEMISGADFRAVRPKDLVKQVKCPVMLIQAGDDPFIMPDDYEAMAAALRSRGNPIDAVWQVDCAGHVLCLAVSPEEFRQRLSRFLQDVSPKPTSQIRGKEVLEREEA